jgi:heme/copper-type cytochrome/quinol oxidase subunit 2
MVKILHLSIIMATLFIIPTVSLAFAAESAGEYIDRKAEIWNLFFRMMVVAFVVGGVIAGTMVWQVWRFRESNPKAKPTPYEEKGEL